MSQNILSQPVGALMRPSKRVSPEDSISIAVRQLRENGAGLVPVVSEDRLQGVLTEGCLIHAIAEDVSFDMAVSDVMIPWKTVAPYATGAEALRTLDAMDLATLVVVDDNGRVLGLLSGSDLAPRNRPPIRPAAVGGMASPFGVYLTTGTVSGGVSKLALLGTGAVMFSILFAGSLIAQLLAMALAHHSPEWVTSATSQGVLTLLLFALGMRLVPMAGVHGAEHKVVHAIERGEELRFEIVTRMPRVHPRCGTNLAAALGIFFTVFLIEWCPDPELRALAAVAVTWFSWKKLGALAQYFVTTRQPSRKQLESGMRAGEQLLENYAKAHFSRPSVPRWIWASGLLHVVAGSAICVLILKLIGLVFHLDLLA